jgi:large subunit ribosomal protein L4
MSKTLLYNQSGEAVGEVVLNSKLFEVSAIESVLYEAVVSQYANNRIVLAHTKGRGDVSGGGKKPWKQKGTGRARHGSIRSPLWKGGGVTFGPSDMKNFSKKLNRKTKNRALAMALSDVVSHGVLLVVDSLVLPSLKTKVLNKILNLLPENKRHTLIIVENENTGIGIAARNLQSVNVSPVNSVNIVDILKAGRVVISKDALDSLEKIYCKK